MELFHIQRYGEEAKEDTGKQSAILEKLKKRTASKRKEEVLVKDEGDGEAKPKREQDQKAEKKVVGDNDTDAPPAKKKKKNRSKKKPKDEKSDGGEFTLLGEVGSQAKNRVKRVLPDWLANPDIVSVDLSDEQMAVEDMAGLDPSLVNCLKSNGVKYFFPVQRQVIPKLLDSPRYQFYRPPDLCVSAPTGSGKTLSFVLPIVQALKGRIVPQVKALVILPVQDLAAQVYKVFLAYVSGTGLRVKLVSGQKSFAHEQQELVAQGVDCWHSLADIVVATPGRIVDHIQKTKGFSLNLLRYLVVDEADRVMEDVQNDWLTHVENAVYLNNRERPAHINVNMFLKNAIPLQKLLFSATLSQNPEKLQQMSLYEPKLFTSVVKPKDIIAADNHGVDKNKLMDDEDSFVGQYTTPAELTELYLIVEDPLKKPMFLQAVISKQSSKKMLVFTKSIESAHFLSVLLKQWGVTCGELSSKVKQKRAKTLGAFKSGKIDVLVSTDALARGIDIDDIDFVVSYDCPHFIKTYIHRVGRTARAGRLGTALTLVEKKSDERKFRDMMAEAGKSNLVKEDTSVDESHLDEAGYEEAAEKAKAVLSEEALALKKKSGKSKPEKKQRKKWNK